MIFGAVRGKNKRFAIGASLNVFDIVHVTIEVGAEYIEVQTVYIKTATRNKFCARVKNIGRCRIDRRSRLSVSSRFKTLAGCDPLTIQGALNVSKGRIVDKIFLGHLLV